MLLHSSLLTNRGSDLPQRWNNHELTSSSVLCRKSQSSSSSSDSSDSEEDEEDEEEDDEVLGGEDTGMTISNPSAVDVSDCQ